MKHTLVDGLLQAKGEAPSGLKHSRSVRGILFWYDREVIETGLSEAAGADDAARLAALLADEAASRGTFGVGAILIENTTGAILDRASNAVVGTLRSGLLMTQDPTAHSEMLLINRYFKAITEGKTLPDPAELTIVTSLEPCAMCAGAIIATGFNVGIVALDPDAGIGAHGTRQFHELPASIQERASNLFAYYGVSDHRAFVGSEKPAFADAERLRTVSSANHRACLNPFTRSLRSAMAVVNEAGKGKDVVESLAGLPVNDPLLRLAKGRLPHALIVEPSQSGGSSSYIIALLQDLYERTPGSSGSAALVDRHGSLLCASAGRPANPAATGLVDAITTYSRFRFDAFSIPRLEKQARAALPHPKYARLFRYPAPDPNSPLTLLEFGTYGSTMEGRIPDSNIPNLLLISTQDSGPQDRLDELIGGMPVLYSRDIGISFAIIDR